MENVSKTKTTLENDNEVISYLLGQIAKLERRNEQLEREKTNLWNAFTKRGESAKV